MMIKNGGITLSPQVNGTRTTSIGDRDMNTRTEPTKATPKGKLQRLLSGISNRSCSLSNTVKNVFFGIGEVFKAITAKWGRGASTPVRMPMQKASATDATAQYNTLLLDLVSGESTNTVTPKNILSPLLNDGKPVPSDRNSDSDKDKKMIFDYLLKNPMSHLFSGDNIRCQGDYIYFNKPISLVRQGDDLLFITNPMEERAISRVKIDTRSGTNGGFRGETAMKVLRDKTLTFTSLADLCQKMTANPQRNIKAMQTGNALANAFNANKKEASFLLYGQHRDLFNAFVTVTGAGDCVPKLDYAALAHPTQWYSAEVSRENVHSRANVVPDNVSSSVSDKTLSAMRRTISPGPGHVLAMAKRFDAQPSITDNASVKLDAPTRKQKISSKIQDLQNTLTANINQNKPLGGGIRQR
ncbi:hypothetical protein [Candidatus Symbiopectobacterium sp. PLON1]|uniref:hypothetical protein n=1 Tax=Candidatus Symbiopectobacterium sp. PLON1 TaxID=2794575 RepID=UPI001A239998|nr:hypothetical protein [Candidatus Symbiopectobacterium sp. PLON1]MBG6247053.1 hypothetical protein [Candidatus Symbiopectobacterium sp. PLON1]